MTKLERRVSTRAIRNTDGRSLRDTNLGPLTHLEGIWSNKPGLEGRGWNMIALPFIDKSGEFSFDYRILMNQYDEVLQFDLIHEDVPNRGVIRATDTELLQRIVTIDYQQVIKQIAAGDFPKSGKEGNRGDDIHHEPGLWLFMKEHATDGLNIARLATIPHGDSVLALGRSEVLDGPPVIDPVNVLPIGVPQNTNLRYLRPYQHFHQHPFLGVFDVLNPHGLLASQTPQNVVETTILQVDTCFETGGIVNIPFIVRHANATEMRSTFWIMETDELDHQGDPIFILQYMQVVMLEFFPRRDDVPGLIKWPHVSFNTMKRLPKGTAGGSTAALQILRSSTPPNQ